MQILQKPNDLDLNLKYAQQQGKMGNFKQKTAYEILYRLVGSEMCIRDSYIDSKIEFYFCVEDEGGASGFIATAVYKDGSCTLTVNDTNTVDDSSC